MDRGIEVKTYLAWRWSTKIRNELKMSWKGKYIYIDFLISLIRKNEDQFFTAKWIKLISGRMGSF